MAHYVFTRARRAAQRKATLASARARRGHHRGRRRADHRGHHR
ncbi:MAG TPA: hypothetical protein VMN82_05670 [Thermoanaerobaculia bacterium]|nr:hypothetical protein [Thermoanaerobaculia bacterium]